MGDDDWQCRNIIHPWIIIITNDDDPSMLSINSARAVSLDSGATRSIDEMLVVILKCWSCSCCADRVQLMRLQTLPHQIRTKTLADLNLLYESRKNTFARNLSKTVLLRNPSIASRIICQQFRTETSHHYHQSSVSANTACLLRQPAAAAPNT